MTRTSSLRREERLGHLEPPLQLQPPLRGKSVWAMPSSFDTSVDFALRVSNRLPIGAANLTVDQRMRELLLLARELEPVRLELVIARVALPQRLPLCDGTAICMHSTLAIDDRRLGSD
jgi:hypothetical protein